MGMNTQNNARVAHGNHGGHAVEGEASLKSAPVSNRGGAGSSPASRSYRELSILFNGDMVRVILEGRKTQTRRPVRFPDSGSFVLVEQGDGSLWPYRSDNGESAICDDGCEHPLASPFGKPGDRLYVRETWADTNGACGPMVSYRAGGDRFLMEDYEPGEACDYSRYPGGNFTQWCGDLRRGEPGHRWRPSIHMPKWAARIWLEVKNVRVERLQSITKEDAVSEGFQEWYVSLDLSPYGVESADVYELPKPVDQFAVAWDSLYGSKGLGWSGNPYVWVCDFEVAEVKA